MSLPIACSLNAADLRVRMAEVAAVGRAGLRDRTTDGATSTLRFDRRDDVRQRLEAIVAAESECCAFLDLTLVDDGEELVLTISAPPGAEPVARELAGAFGG